MVIFSSKNNSFEDTHLVWVDFPISSVNASPILMSSIVLEKIIFDELMNTFNNQISLHLIHLSKNASLQ